MQLLHHLVEPGAVGTLGGPELLRGGGTHCGFSLRRGLADDLRKRRGLARRRHRQVQTAHLAVEKLACLRFIRAAHGAARALEFNRHTPLLVHTFNSAMRLKSSFRLR
jgi:hypothetical protein